MVTKSVRAGTVGTIASALNKNRMKPATPHTAFYPSYNNNYTYMNRHHPSGNCGGQQRQRHRTVTTTEKKEKNENIFCCNNVEKAA